MGEEKKVKRERERREGSSELVATFVVVVGTRRERGEVLCEMEN